MKIVRFLDDTGLSGYGALQADGTARRLASPFDAALGERANVTKLLVPIEPPAIYAIGLNYRHHAEETGAKIPEYPIVFMKAPSALQSSSDPIVLPRFLQSDEVDYEGELAVVIGTTCKNVRPGEALRHVLGYACANDVSARDWQVRRSGRQWCRAKTFDTFCPLGPWIVTADEIADPNALGLRTSLNGRTVQDWTTRDMIFGVPELIAFLSGSTTLLPGTVIITGTPHGVGMARNPPIWLRPGDTVTVEIEGIGALTNPVIEEAL